MEITDKELLAICNLSNLKMEFANLIKEKVVVDKKEIVRNHTISSLLEAEREAILNKKNDSQIRNIFRREKTINQEKTPKVEAIYKDIKEKRTADEKYKMDI